ncbi:MAG: methionine--tRNA ligase [Nitrospinota bacterium]
MSGKPFYVTTPIYYVNDKPHLGHAYTTVAADAKARFHRLRGEKAQMLTGTDEHGQKLEQAAREAGKDPLAFATENSQKFRELWDKLNIQVDDYIRTTEERHKRGVQELWRRVQAAGDIYKDEYEGKYCVACENFLTDLQLVDGKCPDCGRPVESVREESYFFRLSKYEQPLLEYYESHPKFIQPDTRRNEIVSFVRGGLRDLSVSRTSFQWGIPVPGDPKHVIYVWFDALSNYATAAGFGSVEGGSGLPDDTPWPADQHFIGKDILRFHSVYWPAFLLSAGVPLPGQVFSHGWWTIEGQKMSKSLGNAVDPHWLIEEYGVDAIRYFILREIPFGVDGDFSHRQLINRVNSDLANDLGNLLYRTLNMVRRYRGGKLSRSAEGPGAANEEALSGAAAGVAARYETQMEETNLQGGLRSVWELVSAANKYIDAAAPWALAKSGPEERLDSALYHAGAALRVIAAMICPVMPATADKIAAQLGLAGDWLSAPFQELLDFYAMPDGLETTVGPPLFPRIEDDTRVALEKKVAARIAGGDENGEGGGGAEKQKTDDDEAAGLITIENFRRLDLRTATVEAAENIPKSKNLLKLTVSLGDERRTIVAGVAKYFTPEKLIGRTVVIVVNLQPAKLMGVESQGMLLAAEDGGGLKLVGVEGGASPGSRIR